jgi:hypothetical protein
MAEAGGGAPPLPPALPPGFWSGRHHVTYIGPPNGPIQRPKAVRYVQYTCAMKQLRGPKHKNWPAYDPRARALPRLGTMALEVVKMGT